MLTETFARFVVPRFYGNIVGRPLSNKRIAFYQERGFYGKAGGLAAQRAKARRKLTPTLQDLLEHYNL